MPVLVSNQTSNSNTEEVAYEQEETSSFNGNNSQTNNEPVADLFKILDEPLPTNGGNDLNTQNNIFDLLNTNNQPSNLLEDMLFGNDLPQTQSTNDVNSSIPPLTVLNKNGLHIIFNFEKQDQILLIHLQATNSTSIPITNFVFKAAVPRVKTH
jgi:hypothetical protein